jgi:hypothetical protein
MKLKLYKKITFNPQNKRRVVNILNSPRLNSKVIGHIVNRNTIEIYEIHESNWYQIKCGDTIGFIKIEVGTSPLSPNESTVYIANKNDTYVDDRSRKLLVDDGSREFLDDILIIPKNSRPRNSILRKFMP